MHELPPSQPAVCRVCGGAIASDHAAERFCSACLISLRDYDPARDPAFILRLEELFLAHPGEVVRPREALGISAHFKSSVVVAVRRLRKRTGMTIEGRPHTGGYVYRPPA